MSVVRKFEPDVRLKKMLEQPGGVSAEQAIARAKQGLESIREDCLGATDEKIAALQALAGANEPGRGEKMYRLSNEVFAEAGAFGLGELSAVAHSLCSLLVAHEGSQLPRAAMTVHVEAMRALRRPELAGDKAARMAVLQGLRGLVHKFSASSR
jgi:hypothetical protein